jgi:FixJ family two-component response regulator
VAFVCIVDDDASVRKSIVSLLKSAGHTVAAFSSGAALLAAMRPAPAAATACIVLDLKMKGMHGLEVQQALRDRDDITPIIFMSAHGDDESIRRALAGGAFAFLRKPFSSDELLALIEKCAVSLAPEQRSPPP